MRGSLEIFVVATLFIANETASNMVPKMLACMASNCFQKSLSFRRLDSGIVCRFTNNDRSRRSPRTATSSMLVMTAGRMASKMVSSSFS